MNAPTSPRSTWSLRSQLLGLSLLIATPLVALVGYNLYRDTEHDRREATAAALRLAHTSAQNTEAFLADARRLLETLEQRPAVLALDRKACDTLLGDILKFNPRFRNALTVDRDGTLVCSGTALTSATPTRPDPVYWFNRVRDSRQFTIGTPALDFITKRWVVTLAYPLRNPRGEFIGAVGLSVDLVNYPVLPTTAGLPPDAVIAIASYAGTVIARFPDAQNFVGRSSKGSPIRAAALAAKTGQIEVSGLDGVRRVYGFTAIPGSDWYTLAGIPTAVVYAESYETAVRSVLLTLGVLLLVAVAAYVTGHRIEHPLRRIAAAAGAVTAGDRSARAPLIGSSEAVALASRFNAMLDALDASERQFRDTMDNIHLIAVALDKLGNVTYCNDFLLELSGWTREELIGRNWFETVVPDAAPARATFEQAIRDGSLPLHYENEIVTRQGERRLIHWNNTLLRDPANQIVGTVSLGEDITDSRRAQQALQKSEQRLRDLIDGLGQEMFVGLMTPTGTLIEVNRPALAAAGLKPEDVLGKPVDQSYWWSYSEEVRQQLCATVARAAQGESSRYDARVRVGENQFIYIDFTMQPLRDETGKVQYLVGSASVITERKQAEEKIRAQLDELQRWQVVMLGRENRVQQLKTEVNNLLASQGEAARYPSQTES